MAQNKRKSDTGGNARNFDDMSNTELIEYIGGDVDPATDRADLIVMAMEVDDARDERM